MRTLAGTGLVQAAKMSRTMQLRLSGGSVSSFFAAPVRAAVDAFGA